MMLIASGIANSLRNSDFMPACPHENVAANNFLQKNRLLCIWNSEANRKMILQIKHAPNF